ncbi:amidase family protein [Microbacterium sp. JB110]|uniref:amidase family protein n=3 Tax=unclassified Microbacterium TaxID=2609290 RepID=UPI00097F3F26|nr:amidase family protein [Microbacterium sp. JB110]SJM44998.1 Aspartyl-tRNA(Asn) amidotransferase subunit A amidotransferase subunit A [Frigoribacterium sp. JB110]
MMREQKNTRSRTREERKTMTSARRCAVAAVVAVPAILVGALTGGIATAATSDEASAPILMPYYTELDLTGDEQVTTADLERIGELLGTASGDAGWDGAADADGDGVITVADLAEISSRIVYDDGPFELVEASVIDMQAAMNAGVTTSVEITQAYFDRIAEYDRAVVEQGGRALNSIIAVNDTALEAAAAADAQRAESGMSGMLLGVPVAVKDNYDTVDMPTTAGCGCWEDNWTAEDATMVSGLRSDGAVMLAKASMDEFAYGFASEFSAGQAAGESLLVASPYATDRTAGGSSGGTGAAIAANLAGIGFGTDTGGSIRVPSSYNQLVGVRPTIGLASRDGIVPLALSQDTGGPMGRSVVDAAAALDAVVGIDEADPVTSAQQGQVPRSYTEELDAGALEGSRVGFVPSMLGDSPTTLRLWEEAKQSLEARGATVVEIDEPEWFADVLGEGSGSTNEFRHDLDAYIDAHLDSDVEARSLEQVLESGKYVPSRQRTYEQRAQITEQQYLDWAGPEGTHTQALAEFKVSVTGLLDDLDLDTMVYPSTDPYAPLGRNMRLSPNTGMPAVTVPMGQAAEADGTITGAGVNLEFLGRDFAEADLLGYAYAFEQEVGARTSPELYG